MAKTKMLCPFTKDRAGQETEQKKAKEMFDMPSRLSPSPTWLILNEFAERKRK